VPPKPVLTLVVTQGDLGVYAECREFGISVGAPTRGTAEKGIADSVVSHCETVVRRNGSGGATNEQLELANRVLQVGFTFRQT
jgi:hypothetical protein